MEIQEKMKFCFISTLTDMLKEYGGIQMRVLRSCCCIHSCVHLKLICNRMTFNNGHSNTACNLYVHSYGLRSGFSQCFPTFNAVVIEFTPDHFLVKPQPWSTWKLPGTVATNKSFSMSDFHVSRGWKYPGTFEGTFHMRSCCY